MSKRKKQTLTKIDPSLLLKQRAISQYAAEDGTRITATIKPAHQRPAAPVDDLPGFAANVSHFNGEHTEDAETDDDISRGYYVARVCIFSSPSFYT
jgi:hypothetical protein